MSAEATAEPLQRLLEFAAELQRLRSIVLGDAIPATLRAEHSNGGDDGASDDGAAEMAAFLNPPELADPVHRLTEALVQLRTFHLTEPTVADALMSFLVGLGEDYAETEAGQDLLAGLHRSEAAERVRRLWIALSLNTVDVEPMLSARSWAETVLDLSLTGELHEVTNFLRPDGLA